jgi:hypothetical protein
VSPDAYLCNQHDDDHDQADPRSSNTENGAERNLVKGVTVVLPCVPEADVGKADAAPGEESSQTRQRLEPVEGNRSTSVEGHECKRRPCENKDGGPQRPASAVNVSEEAGGVALFGKRTECTGSTVDTRETDGDDREHDDDVGEVGEPNDTGTLSDNDEGRGFNIDEATAQETRVVVRNEQTDESQRQDVEEGDAPENLLDRRRQRPRRVLGFGSSKTDKLSTREGEGGGDKDATEANEVGECARVVPCSTALVCIVPVNLSAGDQIMCESGLCLLSTRGTTTANEDHTHEKENDDR